MKRRILFVDDEPLVLQGLQRSLRSVRHEYDMDFVTSGGEALARMAEKNYDIVVSDMVMPGMDGAKLLREIQQRSPETLRLILSGHAEQQLVVKSVGVVHQCLAKPCDAEQLKATLARLASPQFTVHHASVLKLLPRLQKLPSIPALYSRIVRLLDDPGTSMEALGALIAKDVAISAQILKVVHSSFFGLPRRVTDTAEAVAYLGVEPVKALVLAADLYNQFETRVARVFSIDDFSQHCQSVGAAARVIARLEKAPQSVVDAAAVAGLLHDVGKLVLVANLPAEFQRAADRAADRSLLPWEAEHEIFGADHAEVGGYLLGLWGLPAPVVEAIALHHQPSSSPAKEFSALTAVHAADAILHERPPCDLDAAARAFDTSHLDRLGLTERVPAWRAAIREAASVEHEMS